MRHIVKIADYAVTPIALGTQETFDAMARDESRLLRYEKKWNLPFPFVASLFDEEILAQAYKEEGLDDSLTPFERMCVVAADRAIRKTSIDPSSKRVRFILSTTKGNVRLLDENTNTTYDSSRVQLSNAAKAIAKWFGNSTMPFVVCNACISGLCAQIEAYRMLKSGDCDYVVVIGADEQSPFIVSGFQSFKSLSPVPCRPFDVDRLGLNLGEAAACVIYGTKDSADIVADDWILLSGAIRNDAYHISSPSRVGEGCYNALKSVTSGISQDKIAFISVHGTATMYNDEMEATAISRAGLSNVPVSALKGWFGHTMGAAGVLETIISMQMLDHGVIFRSRGFDEMGIRHPVNISNKDRQTNKRCFVKLLSGFGGNNAAVMFIKGDMI